ncbi:hypothetical protein QYM36_017486 [Artemia franciscana]|uniref:Integrase catalytic domain-containing protein n=1 Tax=Artemia franciscana TaxID=6661 RepID=A0AA88H8N2_ARTSF|nr:hypothetical protein QYM36_017486 [Artemia franciscana]
MIMVCKLLKEKFGHHSSLSKLIHQDLILCEGEDPYPFIEAIKQEVVQSLSLSEVPDSTDASGSVIYESFLRNTLLSILSSNLGMKVMSNMPKSANEIETILVNEFTIREYGRLRLQKLNVTENPQATEVQTQVPSGDESQNFRTNGLRDIKIPKMVIGSAEMVNPNNPSLKSFVNTVSSIESDFKDRTKALRKEEVKEFLDRFRLDHSHDERRIQLEKLLIENHDVLAKSAVDLGSHSEDLFLIEDEIDIMLSCDVIEPYNSPYLAPLLLVKKKAGTKGLVKDYLELNKVIKKDYLALSLISKILDSLGGPLLESVNARNKWILVISDAFSKGVTVVALPNKTANFAAKAFVEKLMLINCPFENLVNDQGKEFCSDILNSIAEIFKKKLDENYMLNKMELQKDVTFKLRISFPFMFDKNNTLTGIVNCRIHNGALILLIMRVKDNLHFIMFLREPRFPFEDITSSHTFYNVESNYKSEILERQILSFDSVKTNLESAKQKQKENYDRDAKDTRFNVEDLVLLHVPPVARHNRLDRVTWLGPYRVILLMGNGINYENHRVAERKTEIFHPIMLKPYVASQPWGHLTTKQFDGIKTKNLGKK